MSSSCAFVTLPEMVAQFPDRFGQRSALQAFRDGDCVRITYADLAYQVRKAAAGLIGRFCVKRGDRIALLSENRPEWAVSYLAILTSGCTVVPIDPLLKDMEIERILSDASVKAVIVSDHLSATAYSLSAAAPGQFGVICLDTLSVDSTSGSATTSLQGLIEEGSEGDALPAILPDDLASLIYTSGTTGQPKGVMLSERNIVADVLGARELIKIGADDVFLSVLPLHHTFECTGGMLCPLSVGATITYSRSLKSKEIIEDIRRSGVTVMLGVPLLFEKMLAGIERAVAKQPFSKRLLFGVCKGIVGGARRIAGAELGRKVFGGLREKGGMASLRLLVSGGAALPATIAEGFNTLGIRLIQGYGLTETSPVATVNPVDRPKHESAGIPIQGVEVRIVEPDREGVGEIAIRGDIVMVGYYRNPDATSAVLRDGWFYTGDLGILDRDGYLHIRGRSKNLIVTAAGKKVFPEEMEEILNRSPYILESMVFGRRTGAGSGEDVAAIVVPEYEQIADHVSKLGREADDRMVRDLLRSEINRLCASVADYKRVKSFELRREELPKTTTRKIKRGAVAAGA